MIQDIKNICSRKHIKYLILLLLGMFIAATIEMVGLGSIPLFIMIIIDINVLISKFPDFFANDYIKNLDQNHLTIAGGTILIIIFFIKNIYLSIYLFFQAKVIKNLRTDITNKLFKKYINATYNFHLQYNPAVLVRNVTSDTTAAIKVIVGTLTIMKESLVLIVVFILLYLNEPTISISVFVLLISICGIFFYFTRKKVTFKGYQQHLAEAERLKIINHALGSIRETKILNRENYLTNLFRQKHDEMEKHAFFMTILSQFPRLFLEFIAVLAISLISILFVTINLPNEQIIPTVSLLAVCCIRLIPAFTLIISSLSARNFSVPRFKLVSRELVNFPTEDKYINKNLTDNNIANKKFFENQIKFENVFFSHENSNAKILKNIFL